MAFRSPQRWQGLGFNLIDCSPEALRVGGLVSSFPILTERSQVIQRVSGYELNLRRNGLECPRVARELPWSVACSSSAVELFAVRVLPVLTLFHLLTPSCFTSSQFETVWFRHR